MFNIGDKVICIDNNNRFNKLKLVVGQKYIVYMDIYNEIAIDDYSGFFENKNFITLVEYRKQKIKQLKNEI
jgi:hypothetical protein